MKRLLSLVLAIFAAGCGGGRAVVVVYSPHGPDVLRDYEERFEAAHPEVDLQWLDMGSQDVYNRIKGEAARPQADVWWGAPSTLFALAAGEDLLEPYRPEWADAVPPGFKDPQDRWHGTYKSPIAIMFNSRRYTRDQVPQTWDALLAPEWAGKVTLRKPMASGTMRTFICAMILRAENEDAGIAWLRDLHKATEAYMENPQFLYDHMRRREDLVSVWLMPDAVLQRERHGYPLDYHLPPQTPVLTEGIALVKGSPHPEQARAFYDFVTTPEALAHQAEAYAKIPARTDIDPATLPDWMAGLEIDAMPVDWNRLAETEQAWCARWENEVYRAP
jgi:iron(III) transport system substrate-binding protein